jgi:dTDP-4-dehydrorhamnose reductase
VRLLVFGRTGQVAKALARQLPADVTADLLGREEADLTDPAACAEAVTACKADAVINAAAWTDVDLSETEEATSTLINADAPGAMARAAATRRLPFLHLSTDYVFAGRGDTPFTPEHRTSPLSAYGRSKLAGEVAVRAAGGAHLILRTSWVFSSYGTNFVKTMLRLGAERDSLRVVADQVGGPTPAAAIADALIVCARAMIEGAAGGTHHFTGSPDTSWAGLARAIMAEAHLPCTIEDIPSTAYPTLARRPLNSRLDCTAFNAAFGIQRADWQAGLKDVIKDLGVNA